MSTTVHCNVGETGNNQGPAPTSVQIGGRTAGPPRGFDKVWKFGIDAV